MKKLKLKNSVETISSEPYSNETAQDASTGTNILMVNENDSQYHDAEHTSFNAQRPEGCESVAIDVKDLLQQNVAKEQPDDEYEPSFWFHWFARSIEFRWACLTLPLLLLAYLILPVSVAPWCIVVISSIVTLFAIGRLAYFAFDSSSIWGVLLVVIPSICLGIAASIEIEAYCNIPARAIYKIFMGLLLTCPLFGAIFAATHIDRIWRTVLLGILSFGVCYAVPIAYQDIDAAKMRSVRQLQLEIEALDWKDFKEPRLK